MTAEKEKNPHLFNGTYDVLAVLWELENLEYF